MFLFREAHQLGQILKARADASTARHAAQRANLDVKALRRQATTALLACEAMWTLLRDKLGVTDEELLERVAGIDMTDGRRDGVVRQPPRDFPACQRPVPQRLERCVYCGAEAEPVPFST